MPVIDCQDTVPYNLETQMVLSPLVKEEARFVASEAARESLAVKVPPNTRIEDWVESVDGKPPTHSRLELSPASMVVCLH